MDTEKLIQQFNSLKKIPSSGNFQIYVGIYDLSTRLQQWEVTNVKKTINCVEQNNSNEIYNQLFTDLKKFTSRMIITVWEPEFLPFNYVILSTIFDGKILGSTNSYGKLRMYLLPIIKYWRLYDGLIPYSGEIDFPMYYQLYYDSKTVKPALIEIHDELENISKKEQNIDNYIKICNKLKKHFLLADLDHRINVISLLKIQDDFFILGNMGQLGSDLFNVFSLEPDHYRYSGLNPLLPFYNLWAFPLLFLPYLLSATLHISISIYQIKLREALKKVNEIKERYRKHDKLDDSRSLDSLLLVKHELNYLLSDFEKIKIMNKNLQNYILKNPKICEKPIVVSPDEQNIDYNLAKNKIKISYLHALNESFLQSVKPVENDIREITKDLKFIQERIKFLQEQLFLKNNSRLNLLMLTMSIVTAGFAIVVGIDVFYRWFNP